MTDHPPSDSSDSDHEAPVHSEEPTSLDQIVPRDPSEVYRELAAELTLLRAKLAAVLRLRSGPTRDQFLTELRPRILEIEYDLDELKPMLSPLYEIPHTSAPTSSTTATASAMTNTVSTLSNPPSTPPTRGHTIDGSTASTPLPSNHSLMKLPSGLPIFRGDRGGMRDADDYVDVVENILVAHGIDKGRFAAALLLGCRGSDAAWVRNNLMTESDCEVVKLGFLNHFRSPHYLRDLHQAFYNLKKGRDSVFDYATKFEQYAFKLNITDHHTLITHFICGLPPHLSGPLSIFSRSSPDSTLADVVQTAIGYEATQSDHYHPKSDSSQYCSHHKKYGHSTADCRYPLKSSETTPLPPAPPAPRASKLGSSCKICGDLNHWADRCPQRRSNTPVIPPATASNAATTAARTSSTSSNGSHVMCVQMNTVTPPPTSFTYQKESTRTDEGFSDLSTNTTEVKLDGYSVTAHIDTMASHSIVTPELVTTAGWCYVPETTSFHLAGSETAVSLGHVTLRCELGCRMTALKFYVLSLPQGIHCLLGKDAQPKLGITLSLVGLIGSPPEPPLITLDTSMTVRAPRDPHSVLSPEPIPDVVTELLEYNSRIPSSAKCTHSDSIIPLDTGDASPRFRRQYRISQSLHESVSKRVREWLEDGVITKAPAGCEWNSSLLVVPGQDGVRVCIDPRHVNSLLRSGDNFMIPTSLDILDQFAGSSIFSALDLKSGYNKFTIAEEDRHKLSFTWEGTQYMFVGCPFGVTHLSSAFQRVISTSLSHLPYVIVYIDNIWIHSRSFEEHVTHLCEVLTILNDINLRLNFAKCELFRSSIEVLGFVISQHGVSIDRRKLVDLEDVPPPTTGKQVQAFLGFCNFFRRHIPAYATLAAPLDELRNVERVTCTTKQEESFYSLKNALLTPSALAFPDFTRPFALATDASSVGIGGILFQPPSDSWSGPPDESCSTISFFSRSLSKSERNYSATKRELLAVIYALDKCRYYLWGRKFTLFTDHKALIYLFSQKDANALLQRWFTEIMEFNFDIVHIDGVRNLLPDALSRLYPISPRDTKNDVFPHNFLLRLLPEENELLEHPPIELRTKYLEEAHNLGHCAAASLVSKIREKGIYWTSILRDAHDFVSRCTDCQRFSLQRAGFHPLKSVLADCPMQHVAMDLAGPLTKSQHGNVYLFVLVDVFTRFIFLRAIPNKEASTIAMTLYRIFCDVGFPSIIQSDNGSEFVNETIHHLTELVNVDHRCSTPYHPRGNGVAERFVQTSRRSIKRKLQGNTTAWDLTLPAVQLDLNTRVIASHRSTPFALFFARAGHFGHHSVTDTAPDTTTAVVSTSSTSTTAVTSTVTPTATSPIATLCTNSSDSATVSVSSSNAQIEKWKEVLKDVEDVVFPSVRAFQRSAATKRTSHHRKTHKLISFNVGTYVMTHDETRSDKLSPVFEGPFKVARRNKGGAYLLTDTDGTLLPRSYAPSQLIQVPAPAAPVPHDTVYIVDKILRHRRRGNTIQYLTKWKGYDDAHNSWEPHSSFFDILPITLYWKAKRGKVPDDTADSDPNSTD
jgi:transposase InsO family protein